MMLASRWYNAGAVFTKLIASLYRTVADCYNLMTNFIASFSEDTEFIGEIKEVIGDLYVLIAVFMFFRITLTLIEYLIDPDKSSDKNVGAGKLITRIVISLLLLVAGPFLFEQTVILQEAILADDGILNNIFTSNDEGTSGDSSSDSCNIKKQYEDGKIKTLDQLSAASIGCKANSKLTSEMASVAEKIDGKKYTVLKIKESYIVENLLANLLGGPAAGVVVNFSNIPDAIEHNEEFLAGAKWIRDTLEVDSAKFIKFIGNANYIVLAGPAANEDVEYDISGTDGAFFARSIVASFSNNPSVIKNPTESGKYFLDNSDADDDIAKMVEEDEIQLSLFVCLICGIVMIVLVLILCIEVIIRELKLVTLELFSPIAFVSYMNPNDKVLGNWFQKYIGCYLDLFLKLLAIKLGVFLVSVVIEQEFSFGIIGTVLLYIGIFIFMKTIPNLISDVLGIKNMGGTFKESMKGLKTAAGIGAGAIAGGVAGFASGFGKGGGFTRVAGGLLGGTFRGAQGGAKGKIFQGASTQIKRNSVAKNLSAQGVGWFDRMGGRTGLNDKQSLERQISKYKEEASKQGKMTSYADKAEESAKKIMKKGKMDKVPGRASKYQTEVDKLTNLSAAAGNISKESIASSFNKENYMEQTKDGGFVFNKQKYDRDIESAYQTAVSNANSAAKGQNKYIHASGADVKNAKRDLEELNNKRNSITKENVATTFDRKAYYDNDGKFMEERFNQDVNNKYELLKRNADEEYNTQKFFVEALDNERDLAQSELKHLQEREAVMKKDSNTKQEDLDKISESIDEYTRYVNSLDYEHLDEKQINSFEDDAVSQTYNESTDAEIATLKQTADIELGEFDVNNATGFLEVKAKGKAAKARKEVATSNANAIENSEHFRNVKNAESLKNSK